MAVIAPLDGAAPPFILLVLATAIMAGLFTVRICAVSNSGLLLRLKWWLYAYAGLVALMAALTVFRIASREVAAAHDFYQVLPRLDFWIEFLTFFVLSAGPVCFVPVLIADIRAARVANIKARTTPPPTGTPKSI